MGGRGVAKRGMVEVMVVVVVGLFRERPRGVAALPVCVDGPVVVRAGPVFAAVVASSAEEQAHFIAILPTVAAATAAGRYGVPAAGVAMSLLPATSCQEDANERHDQ